MAGISFGSPAASKPTVTGNLALKPSTSGINRGVVLGSGKPTPSKPTVTGNMPVNLPKPAVSFGSPGQAPSISSIVTGNVPIGPSPSNGFVLGASTPAPAGQPGNGLNMVNPAQQQAAAQAQQQAAQAAAAQEQARQQAAAVEAQRIANARAGFDAQRQGIYGSIRSAGAQAGDDYKQGILGLLDQLRAGQTAIDRQSVQNELARKQGTQGVLGMVGRGIQSAGVMLNNKNASDSSASGAIARAYGQLGQRQLSDVGNQYAQGENALQQSQADLALQQAAGQRQFGADKARVVNNIVAQAENSLSALNAQMINTPGITDRIQLEQEKERIRSETMQALAQYDDTYNQGVAGIKPISQDNRRSEALRLASAGQAPENAFDFTEQAPAQFAGTGPFASDLPIFTFARGRKFA